MHAFGLLGIPTPRDIAKAVAHELFSFAVQLVAAAIQSLLDAFLRVVTATTTPVFDSGWWVGAGRGLLGQVAALSAAIAVLVLVLAALEGIWSGSTVPIGKALAALPGAVLKTAVLVPVTKLLVDGTDAISASLLSSAGAHLGVSPVLLAGAIGTTDVVGVAIAGLLVLGMLAVWAELALRAALVYLVVMTAPLVLMASVHPRLRPSWTRFVELGAALVFSKVLVALALAVGFSELGGRASTFGSAVGELVAAVGTLALACFSPYVLFRLISVETAHLEGVARRPARAALGAAQLAGGFGTSLSSFLDRGGAPPASGGSSGQPGGPPARGGPPGGGRPPAGPAWAQAEPGSARSAPTAGRGASRPADLAAVLLAEASARRAPRAIPASDAEPRSPTRAPGEERRGAGTATDGPGARS